MATVKPYKSETLWFALALVVLSSISDVLASDAFKALVGDNFGWIGTAVGISIAWLRFKTTKPVEPIQRKKNLEVLDVHDPEFMDE